eukprot:tig00021582_g22626.t1
MDAADAAALKLRKEAFVHGLSGTSTAEVLLVSSVAPAALFARTAILHALERPETAGLGAAALFAVDFITLVLPVVLSFTWTHLTPAILATCVTVGASLVYVCERLLGRTVVGIDEVDMNASRRPVVSSFRGFLLLMTGVAILAVDFPVFPRRFAKTETFGVSLGASSWRTPSPGTAPPRPPRGRPAGDIRWRKRRREPGAVARRLAAAWRSALPLLALGAARLLSVKASNYQEHVSEYGVHWNFFFTLAAVCLLAAAFDTDAPLAPYAATGLAAGYQYTLSRAGLEAYVLDAPRVDLLSANREGLFSTAGYLAIYLAAVRLGYELMKPRVAGAWRRLPLLLAGAGALLFGAVAACDAAGLPVSRRLANAPYALWVLAYSASLLAPLLAVHALLLPAPSDRARRSLLEALNRNALPAFLLANVLTGATNKAVATLETPDAPALAILLAYQAAVSLPIAALHARSVSLKFW